MRSICRCAIIVLAVACINSGARAQQGPIFFSPGVKIGYDFANGFVFGLEASLSVWPKDADAYYGLSLNFDMIGGKFKRAHIGVEAGLTSIGAQLGPTWIYEQGKPVRLGSTFALYTGFWGMPYVAFTTNMLPEGEAELGILGKLPIQVNDASIDLL